MQTIRDAAINKQVVRGNQHYILELGMGKRGGSGGGSGHPRNKHRKKGGVGGLQLHNNTDKQWHGLSEEKKAQVRVICGRHKHPETYF
jgi:hypothetical protein